MVRLALIAILVAAAAAGGFLIHRVLISHADEVLSRPPSEAKAPSSLALSQTAAPADAPSATPPTSPPTPADQPALSWDFLRDSEGEYGEERSFPEELTALDGKVVSLVGFMAPLDDYADVNTFILLPFPTCCYYCAAPEPNEVLYIELAGAAKTDLDQYDPVEISGNLALWREPEEEFLFGILDATVQKAVE